MFTYYMTNISAMINIPIVIIQKLPILARMVCKWPNSSWALPTNLAARPKNVLRPVPITIASPSPCLQVEPEKTSSPTDLFTGSDSPVNAAWSIETSPCATIIK
jgi:hypothetical protein